MNPNKILFDECIKEAIEIGRKYMKRYDYDSEDLPTQQEWNLALVLFKNQLEVRNLRTTPFDEKRIYMELAK